jgi:hypothetical protein
MSFIKKTYVWSVCIEPLVYFLFMDYIYAANLGVSRVLQIVVVLSLLIRVIINGLIVRGFKIFDPRYKYYSYYMLFSVFSAIFGLIIGAYTLPSISIEDTMFISVYRPITEYIIAIYYFFYFVILARFMLNDHRTIDYFLNVFSALFYFCLIFGLLDLVIMQVLDGYGGFHRQIRGSVGVGWRFHGIAGEPRDAFVYLWLGIGVLYLKDIWRSEQKLTITRLLFIFLAMIMTQSASGLFGLMISCVLLLLYYFPKITFKQKIITILLIILINVIVFIQFTNPDGRLYNYYVGLLSVYDELLHGYAIKGNLLNQMSNIYPIWSRWTEVMNFNIVPSFVGTGFGSSSVINNVYMMDVNVVRNPNANITRMIYDVGIIGTVLLIKSFIYPIQRFNVNKDMKFKLLLYMLFIVGAFLGHRSVAPFLFLGVLIIVIENKFPVSLNKD